MIVGIRGAPHMKALIVFLFFGVALSYSQEHIPYDDFVKRLPNIDDQDKAAYKSHPEARNLMWALVKGLASRTLAKLGYGTGPFLSDYGPKEKNALETFQKDLGIPVTGILDSLTMRGLEEAEEFFFHANVTLPTKSVWITERRNLAHASGTWRALNFDDAFPFNTQEITFHKRDMMCEVSSAVIRWDRKGLLNTGRFVQIFTDLYTITHWDDDLIVAESEAICTKSILTLNLKTEEVTLTTHVIKTDGDCQFLDKQPKFSTLINGVDLYSDKKWQRFYNILNKNSDAPAILQKLQSVGAN